MFAQSPVVAFPLLLNTLSVYGNSGISRLRAYSANILAVMDEPQFNSNNDVVSTITEEPLALAVDAESLSSEQIYISELTVLLMKSSQELAAATVSSSQNWPHKIMSMNDDEIEPEYIRDELYSSLCDDNNANATLTADLIAKMNELNLSDTSENTIIDLTSSSDVLSRTTEESLALVTDSPDVVSLPISWSEQTYISEMMVLLVRPSRESDTAESGDVQYSFCSCDDCNNANKSSFPANMIVKEQELSSDTKNTPDTKERKSSMDSAEEANEDILQEHRLDSAIITS